MASISYARHRFPPDVIRHAVWLFLRFTLSYRDVEELLAERGLDVSYETIRRWVLEFGLQFARNCAPSDHCQAANGISTRWSSQSAASASVSRDWGVVAIQPRRPTRRSSTFWRWRRMASAAVAGSRCDRASTILSWSAKL
jgi:hypothetical protein